MLKEGLEEFRRRKAKEDIDEDAPPPPVTTKGLFVVPGNIKKTGGNGNGLGLSGIVVRKRKAGEDKEDSISKTVNNESERKVKLTPQESKQTVSPKPSGGLGLVSGYDSDEEEEEDE
jgi:hypothetical protein